MNKTIKSCLKKTVAVLAATTAAFSLYGCSNGSQTPIKETVYDGDMLHFTSSDTSFAEFMNDFAERNLRFNENSVSGDSMTLGTGTGFAKNWETMSLVWHNSTGNILGNDKLYLLKKFLTGITQDDLGMIYNTHNTLQAGASQAGDGIPQGWPFPTHKNSNGRVCAFEFNTRAISKWKPTSGGTFTESGDGYAHFKFSGSENVDFDMVYNDLSPLISDGNGIDSTLAPFVEIEIAYTDADAYLGAETAAEDISVIWKTENGGDEWFEAPMSLYCTAPEQLEYSFWGRKYFQMYLHPDWDGNTITALGVRINCKDGKKLNLTDGKINYIRPGFDTRQSNATYQFLLAVNNYVSYTNDTEFLQTIMPKARKAITFLTHALKGEEGLLDISYFYGHDGIGAKVVDGKLEKSYGSGLGNGYWDILTAPEVNLEANTYFYQALKAMANLERRVTVSGITVEESSSVKNRYPYGERVDYAFTAQSLDDLASKVKANIEKDIKPERQADGTYKNAGGLWNPSTGRFASGIRKDNGAIIDYGFVYWNEEAIAAGIGTESQKKSALDWISGKRSVPSDTSTGDDIYFYEFAPRFSTLRNTVDYGFYYTSPRFSTQVQDGGAVMCWSYYDLMSRKAVYGVNDTFERLKGIQKWYEKVVEAGGEGLNFYSDYYMYLEDGTGRYTLQQSGLTNGAIGLDTEFLESIMLINSVPNAFFGMSATEYNTVSFTNDLPDKLDWIKIDNLLYGGVRYSARLDKNSITIDKIKNNVSNGYKISFNFKEPSKNYKVYVDGKEVTDYTAANGTITVTTEFKETKVEIKEA